MLRRTFLSAAAALVLALSPIAAFAGGTVDYKPGLIKKALSEGKTVFVDYAATWCGTCKAQERVVERLRKENPAYNKSILFVRVDWDDYGSHEVSKSRNIPRRSTLLMLRGDKELGRIVAGTSKTAIMKLLDSGLRSDS